MKIAILMATYNSADAIHIQLDSIINQTYTDWELFIHDDGSTDGTLDIIKHYQDKDYRIHKMHDENPGRGACGSFLWLLENVESEYYMFCDHDDLWLPFKIDQSYAKLLEIEKNHGSNKPICIHTDLAITDYKYNVTGSSLRKMEKARLRYGEQLKYMLVRPCVTGCTMIINKAAKTAAFPLVNGIPMHDWWIACKTLANGGIVDHLDKSTILYRQTDHNVIGAQSFSLSKKLKSLKDVIERGNRQRKFNILHFGTIAKDFWFAKLQYVIIRLLRI